MKMDSQFFATTTTSPRGPRREIWLDQIERRMMELALDMEDAKFIIGESPKQTEHTGPTQIQC